MLHYFFMCWWTGRKTDSYYTYLGFGQYMIEPDREILGDHS